MCETPLTLGNSVQAHSTYDAANRLTSLTTKKGTTTLASFIYTYDALGNRTNLTDSAGLHSYTYDGLSQVTSATNPSTSYAYDALGNRTTAAGQTYTTNPLNQYTQVGPTLQTYDPTGNLTSDGVATYTYDADNRLTQVTKGATTVTLVYDPFGLRISKNVNGVATRFLYDGDQVLAETDNTGTLIARYLSGPRIDEPLERKAGSTTHYYSADGLGSIVHLTTSTGTIAESYTYEVFGQPTIRNGAGTVIPTSALGNRFLFTGREWDAETGLYDYRRRYYHPRLGRFLSREPFGISEEVNLYRYVGNTPTTWIDPEGLLSLIYGGGNLGGGQRFPPIGSGPTLPIDRPPQPRPGKVGVRHSLCSLFSLPFTDDALSRRSSLMLPNGVVSSYTYDPANRLMSLATTP